MKLNTLNTLIDDILPHIPKNRADDVVIFDPSDIDRPVGLNMLEADSPEQMDFAIQEMIAIFSQPLLCHKEKSLTAGSSLRLHSYSGPGGKEPSFSCGCSLVSLPPVRHH